MRKIAKVLLVGLVCALLLMPAVMTAQEEATTETATSQEASANPIGVTSLIFLMGAGAIVVVGGAMLARDSYREDAETA